MVCGQAAIFSIVPLTLQKIKMSPSNSDFRFARSAFLPSRTYIQRPRRAFPSFISDGEG